MSQIAPEIGRYLQMRARAWLAEDRDRSATDLATAAKISKERVSVLINSGSVGWDIAVKIGKVFGFKSMTELLPAATEWARHEPPPPASTATVRLPSVPSDRLALACAIALEDGATDAAIASVIAEAHALEGESIFRIAVRIARRDLELADGTYQVRKNG